MPDLCSAGKVEGGEVDVVLGCVEVEDPVLPPAEGALDRYQYLEDLGEATELWDRIWTEIKAG